MKNVVLIGASGFVGTAILNELLNRGHKVTAIVRDLAKVTASNPNLKVVQADVTDTDVLIEASKGKDTVISAYNPGWKNPNIYEETLKRGCVKMNCTPKVRHKTLGVFFMKYSYEQRLIIVSRVKQGEAIAHLSKEYHISETEILAWVRMWDHYGRSGLEQQSHCRPTVKLKEEVVRLILEKGVPLAHVRVEYRIGKTALQRWVSVVRKYGYGALEPSKRRGRPPKYPMGRPKKKEPQTELERLQAENLRLKAENALLKKAKALVEAKKAQALLNGHGPSTN